MSPPPAPGHFTELAYVCFSLAMALWEPGEQEPGRVPPFFPTEGARGGVGAEMGAVEGSGVTADALQPCGFSLTQCV